MAGEILRVEGDDGIGAAGDGGGKDMAVVRVGKDQAGLDLRLFADQAAREGGAKHCGLASAIAGAAGPSFAVASTHSRRMRSEKTGW
jgi:hypothetical protein